MTLDQLRIFMAVAEREHVTQAAQVVNLSQSAVSAAIAALEDRHAVRLFDRVGRRVVLTAAGRLFMAEARGVLSRAHQAEQVLSELAGLTRGMLRLAGSQTVANYWLPRHMAAFRCAHPGFVLCLDAGNTAEVIRLVRDGTVDLGFVEGQVDDKQVIAQSVPGDELALVVAPGHPWAEVPPRTADEMRRGPWVVREEGSGTRAMLETALAIHGLTLKDVDVAFTLPSNEAVKSVVEAGAGATILSTLVLSEAFASRKAVRVPLGLPPRDFHILRHRDKYLSLAERRFLEMIASSQGAMTDVQGLDQKRQRGKQAEGEH
jgi:DNA-binding transcriptional LysR family regulator